MADSAQKIISPYWSRCLYFFIFHSQSQNNKDEPQYNAPGLGKPNGTDQEKQMHAQLSAAGQILQIIVQNVNLTANCSLWIACAKGGGCPSVL